MLGLKLNLTPCKVHGRGLVIPDVNTFDLSTAMGIPGQFEKEEFQNALRHIQKVCAAAGKPSIIYAASEKAVKDGFAIGFDSVTYNMDVNILINAYKEALKRLKE